MFLAVMKMHEKFDRSDVRFSSEGINQMGFFWPPAVFYAWAAPPLMTYEPSAAHLLHRHCAVPLKQHFQTRHIRTRSLRRPHWIADSGEFRHAFQRDTVHRRDDSMSLWIPGREPQSLSLRSGPGRALPPSPFHSLWRPILYSMYSMYHGYCR